MPRIQLLLTSLILLGAAQASAAGYAVRPGDTLTQIARTHHLRLDSLVAANPQLGRVNALRVGQTLHLPDPGGRPRAAQDPVVRATAIPRDEVGWRTPLRGVLTTRYFGYPGHAGIDIAAPHGSLIVAARSGTVVESTFDGRGGWGWTVVINHGGGVRSRYSHNSANLVRVGDAVAGGQAIARVGSTGHSTGPHLDYRVTVAGRPVNPSSLR